MLSLDDDRWSSLEGAYKTPYDPRPALERIRRGHRTEETGSELWNELHHQGDIGMASLAAVPYLVDIQRYGDAPDWNVLGLIALIEQIRLEKGPGLPPWLSESYTKAIGRIPKLALKDILRSDDPLVLRSALGAIAIVKRLDLTARFFIQYRDDLREMERLYWQS
jgi:hypothetical protein